MKKISVLLISAIFIGSGVLHFTHDTELVKITPLPYALEIVYITGLIEFALAFLILLPNYRQTTGIFLAVFCLAVLPANINMALNDIPMFGSHVEPLGAWFRVFIQLPLIGWILWSTGFWSEQKNSLISRGSNRALGQKF
jgi:uncharacterized membrane protein